MRLALMAGAENVFAGIAETYVPAEREYEQAELPASEEIKETEVGNIITVPVEILDESGETAQISGDPRFHDVYYDGQSHYYIACSVLSGGTIPVFKVYTEAGKYYRVTESGDWLVLPYDEEN